VRSSADLRAFIDFVKAAGIAGIFCYHLYGIYVGSQTITAMLQFGVVRYLLMRVTDVAGYFSALFQTLFSLGSIGAELFVIASGFGLYHSHCLRRRSWRAFYVRRFLRVAPLYYVALLFAFFGNTFLLGNPFYASAEGLRVLAYHLFFLQTFNESYIQYGFFYFVAIIVQLYLLFPLLVKLMESISSRLPVFVLSFFLSPVLEIIFQIFGVGFKGVLVTDYLPYFMLGTLIAESHFRGGCLSRLTGDMRTAFIAFVALIAVVYLVSYWFDYNRAAKTAIVLFTFLSLLLPFELLKTVHAEQLARLFSYSSYVFFLTHVFFLKLGLLFFLNHGILNRLLSWVLIGSGIFVAAMISSFLFQKGYDSAIRFFSRQSRPASVV
jgi:peptidoglycan/LPS O-acetylase OafA/YrhL